MKSDPKTDPRAIKPAPLPVVKAIKAIAGGTASEHQQKLFMEWLVESACGFYDRMAYFGPDAMEKTFFALGRRRVGELIRNYANVPLERFNEGKSSEQVG